MHESALKAFERPDEIREFPFGRFEIVHIAGVTLGRATYQPGWKWSVHNAPIVGTKFCHAPHTGTVLSGHGAIQFPPGILRRGTTRHESRLKPLIAMRLPEIILDRIFLLESLLILYSIR